MSLSFVIFIFALAIGFLAWLRYRDSRYLKKKTKDVLSPAVREMIENEKEEFIRKQQRFDSALGKARERYRKTP